MRPVLLRPPAEDKASVRVLTVLALVEAGAIDEDELTKARRDRVECLQCHGLSLKGLWSHRCGRPRRA